MLIQLRRSVPAPRAVSRAQRNRVSPCVRGACEGLRAASHSATGLLDRRTQLGRSRSRRTIIVIGSLVAVTLLTWVLYRWFYASTDLGSYPQTTAVPAGSQASEVWDIY